MNPHPDNGLTILHSPHSVDTAVTTLTGILAAKGIKLFALVDHSGEAARVGLTMRPTKLLLFGDPKAGTPVMLAAPTSAIDLPLKILVAQAEDGSTRITYNTPAYLGTRHHIPADLLKNLSGIEPLAAKLTE